MQSRRGGLPARRGIRTDGRVWSGNVSSGGEQRLKCWNTGLGCLHYKLAPRSIFSCFFWGVLFSVCVLAEAIVTEHCLWEAFPDLPFFFALVVLAHPSHSEVSWWFGVPCVFWQHSECFRIRTQSLLIFELHAYTEYIAGPSCINNN